MDALRKSGDSVGARVNVVADGVPPGWGEPVYGKLDAELASAMMCINAVKGVEIGAGFGSIDPEGQPCTATRSSPAGFLSNHAGGVLGGISSGQPVTCSVAFKPTSSLRLPGRTIDVEGKEVEVVTTGRHDPCVGLRAHADLRGDDGAGADGPGAAPSCAMRRCRHGFPTYPNHPKRNQ